MNKRDTLWYVFANAFAVLAFACAVLASVFDSWLLLYLVAVLMVCYFVVGMRVGAR